MTTISTLDPKAVALVAAIHSGDLESLRRQLTDHPQIAAARFGDDHPRGMSRSALHLATDWPGHFPNVATTIALLVEAGADVDAKFRGPHQETPLHWAASSDDLDAVTALLDLGADIDAEGGVIAGSTPLRDATAFAQWGAGRALIARGARASIPDLASLGMTADLLAVLDDPSSEFPDALDHAFWAACHGGQLETAQVLADRGAHLDWLPGWEDATPLDIAARDGAHDVVRWLHSLGARTCNQVKDTG